MAGLCIVSCRNGLGVYQYKNAVNRIKGINEYLLRESLNDICSLQIRSITQKIWELKICVIIKSIWHLPIPCYQNLH